MGLDIKRNKKGLYKAKSTISDKSVSDTWMTEDELKKYLIERAYSKFITDVIEIDMEFPSGYSINDQYQYDDEKHCKGKEFVIKNWNNDGVIEDKFKEIIERLKIEL